MTDIEIIQCYPAIYIKSLDAIVIADLHLGYEGIMAEHGIYIPKIQFKREKETIERIIEIKNADRIIINGDVKHEFSETSYHEFKEVGEMFSFLKKNFKAIDVVKGNHDNFIIRITKKFEIPLHEELEIGEYLFIHGHQLPTKTEDKFIITAHEHPAIAIFDEAGVKEKFKCFLIGKKMLVLPAFSYLAQGSEVNIIPKSELLSPVLRKENVDEFDVIGITEIGCLNFGKLKNLRI